MHAASVALEHIIRLYDQLPSCGKARDDEYTVLAAIYVVKGTSTNPMVLSLATGTKCIGKDLNNDNGCLLSDSHAEILARRTFVRYLCEIIHELCVNPEYASSSDCPWNIELSGALSLKEDWKFHLYISDSPCGDASIYDSNVCCGGITGAKLLNSNIAESGADCQPCTTLRTKSGRSDIKSENRTTSMSCSDKICRWCCLGLQGACLSAWTPRVYLSSIAVDKDPSCSITAQHEALNRAIADRLGAHAADKPVNSSIADQSFAHIPELFILPAGSGFSHGKAATKFKYPVNVEAAEADTTVNDGETHTSTEHCTPAPAPPLTKKRKRNPLSPCGFSINWQRSVGATARSTSSNTNLTNSDGIKEKERKAMIVAGGTVEVTIAHTGALQGSVKKNVGEAGAASRLSRHAMRTLFDQIATYCLANKSQSQLCTHLCEQLASEQQVVDGAVATPGTGGTGCKDVDAVGLRTSYGEFKRQYSNAEYRRAKEEFLAHPIFKDWLCD